MVSVKGLSKNFGHLRAVDHLDLDVARGEVLGFLGPNGSGKSTTMKMITGFLAPSAGTVQVCGIDVQLDPIQAQRHIGYLPEGASAYADMTPNTYLRFIADVRQLSGAARHAAIERVVALTHLQHVLHQPIDTLSKGFKRRVGLAQALLHDPDVLILDEPTDGLDPNQKHEVRALIREMAVDKAIIISTHILEEVEALCSRAVIISNGQVLANGTPDELEHRSRYYNAVSVLLTSQHVETVRVGLAALADVDTVEVGDAGHGKTALVAVPVDGADILAQVSRLIRQNAWHVDEVRLERGHLDDVFRALTAGSTAHKASADALTSAHVHSDLAQQVRHGQDGTARTPLATSVHDVWSICRRELVGYFTTPVAYVFLVIFLASIGAFTFFLGKFFTAGQATLDSFFLFHPWLYLFLIPAIAMRLWAEERKSGSIELLLTLPVTTLSAVLGKFIAAWAVAGIGLVLTTSIWLTVNYLGSPDNGAIATSYIGSFLMAGGYLAIGSFVSAITRNQVIAFILAASLCFVFTASGLGVVLDFFSGWAPRVVLDIVANFSFLQHFRDIARGVIDLRDVVFFVSTIVFFLFANVVTVEYKKSA